MKNSCFFGLCFLSKNRRILDEKKGVFRQKTYLFCGELFFLFLVLKFVKIQCFLEANLDPFDVENSVDKKDVFSLKNGSEFGLKFEALKLQI